MGTSYSVYVGHYVEVQLPVVLVPKRTFECSNNKRHRVQPSDVFCSNCGKEVLPVTYNEEKYPNAYDFEDLYDKVGLEQIHFEYWSSNPDSGRRVFIFTNRLSTGLTHSISVENTRAQELDFYDMSKDPSNVKQAINAFNTALVERYGEDVKVYVNYGVVTYVG